MSNDNAGRPSRTTSGNGPVGSAVALVITAVALILGFLILRKMNDNDSSSTTGGNGGTEETTTTSIDPNATTTSITLPTTTTEPALVTTGTKVQVANCSTQNGAAGKMTTALSGVGFLMADPTNCSPTQAKLATTQVLYDETDTNAQAVAESLGRLLGGLIPEAKANPVPNEAGVYPEGTGVLILLGDDTAGKTLDQIAGKATTGTTAPPSSGA